MSVPRDGLPQHTFRFGDRVFELPPTLPDDFAEGDPWQALERFLGPAQWASFLELRPSHDDVKALVAGLLDLYLNRGGLRAATRTRA